MPWPAYVTADVHRPIRHIREVVLHTLRDMSVCAGEIVEQFPQPGASAQSVVDDFVTRIHANPAVHTEETGWRDDGLHRDMWSMRTLIVRSDEPHHSCAEDWPRT